MAANLGPEARALDILDRARAEVTDLAAWNSIFDAEAHLINRAEYQRAYGTGSLADRDGE